MTANFQQQQQQQGRLLYPTHDDIIATGAGTLRTESAYNMTPYGGSGGGSSSRLRPYLSPDPAPHTIMSSIWGSAFVTALPWIAALNAVMVLWMVVRMHVPSVPADGLWIAQLTFVVTTLLGSKYTRGEGKYRDSWRTFRELLSNVTSLAGNLVGSLAARKASNRRALIDLNHLVRALPYAFKHTFRHGIDVGLLPLPDRLREEIFSNFRNAVVPDRARAGKEDEFAIEAINYAIGQRLAQLRSAGAITDNNEWNCRNMINGWNNSAATIGHYRAIPAPSGYQELLNILTFIYLSFVALMLQEVYTLGWAFISLNFLAYAFYGFFKYSERIDDPFRDPDENPYLRVLTIGRESDSAAESVDRQFGIAFAELGVTLGEVDSGGSA